MVASVTSDPVSIPNSQLHAEVPILAIPQNATKTSEAASAGVQSPSKPIEFNVLEISDIFVTNVPSVAWKEKNSLYVLLKVNGFHFRTPTLAEVGADAMWTGGVCSIDLQRMLSKQGNDAKIIVELYNEHLAIKDKLIGKCDFSCITLLEQATASAATEISGELLESAATTAVGGSRKYRGTVAFNYQLGSSQPSPSNWQAEFESIPATARSRTIDIEPNNLVEINGVTPRRIMAAADVLQAWEQESTDQPSPTKLKAKKETKKGRASSSSHGRPPTQQQTSKLGKESIGIAQLPSTPQRGFDIVPTLPSSHSYEPETVTSVDEPSSAITTSRMSNLTEEVGSTRQHTAITGSSSGASNSHQYQHSKHSRTKRLQSEVHRMRSSATNSLPTTAIEDMPAVVDITYVFDKVFQMSFQTVCASVELSAMEILILLDSLGQPVQQHWLENASLSSSSSGYSALIVPISHAAAFADGVSNYIHQFPQFLDSVQFFRFTPEQASLAIKHLIRLIKGKYEATRSLIFQYCQTISGSSLAGSRRSSSAASTSEKQHIPGVRPRNFDLAQTQVLLEHLDMNTIVRESAYNGSTLLELDLSAAASSSLSLKSALKRARMQVYQKTLQTLDTMWDKGIRPFDAYPNNDQHSAAGYQSKNSKSYLANDLRSLAGTHDKDLASDSEQKPSQKPRRKSVKITGSGSAERSYIIADAARLFQTLVPINRAYGCGFSLQELSNVANTMGGFLCFKEQLSDKALATDAVDDIDSHPLANSGGGNQATGLSQQAQKALVWVKVLFPSKEIKQHALTILENLIVSRRFNNASISLVQIRPRDVVSHPSNQDGFESTSNLHSKHSDESVDIFLQLPPSCLESTSIGVSKLLQMSRGKLGDVQLGTRARVVDALTLQRMCERYEWWDRPSVDTMNRLAGQKVEVVSVADLDSKGRVGIKLVNDETLCDAVPLDALQPLLAVASTALFPGEDGHETMLKKRRKSKLRRANSERVPEAEQRDTEAALNPLRQGVGGGDEAAPPAAAIDDDHIPKKKLKRRKSRASNLHPDADIKQAPSTVPVEAEVSEDMFARKKSSTKISRALSLEEDLAILAANMKLPVPAMAVDVKVQRADTVYKSHEASNANSMNATEKKPSVVASSTRPASAPSTSRTKSASSNSTKDCSWMRSPKKAVEQLLHDDINNRAEVGDHKRGRSAHGKDVLRASAPLHQWVPTFPEGAEYAYTKGVYVYPSSPPATAAPESPQNDVPETNPGINSVNPAALHLLDITVPPSPPRPVSASAIGRLKKQKQQEKQQGTSAVASKAGQESPPSSPPLQKVMGVSGYGYTATGDRKPMAAFEFLPEEGEDPEAHPHGLPGKKVKKVKSSTESNKAALKQLFGMNERKDTAPAEKEETTKLSSRQRRKEEKNSVVDLDVAGAPATLQPKSPENRLNGHVSKEDRYYEIESARTANEAAKKEKYLLKQLKKMSV